MKYDYIIAGAGCSGLSLLYKILQTHSLQKKSILVIDKNQKKNNDRTWCFWEKNPGSFESIVYAKWNTLEFISDDTNKKVDLGQYTYKMIQGIHFYNFVLEYAKKFKNVVFIQESIIDIDSIFNEAKVITKKILTLESMYLILQIYLIQKLTNKILYYSTLKAGI